MKSWVNLILCLLLSFGIWLMYNLSQDYNGLVSVDVIAQSNLEGRSRTASAPEQIVANCRTTGFRLMRLNSPRRHKPVRVFFESYDLQHRKGDVYDISPAVLVKYASAIFGDGVTLEAVVSDNPSFRFAAENCKKVPVVAVKTVSFRPQYMQRRPMSTVPDSVLVYGEPSRLASIDAVMTRPINLGEVRSNVHGVAKLEKLPGVRISEDEVAYELEITRFVEVNSEFKVGTRNVPAGKELAVYPSSASVSFRCVFPVEVDPSDVVEVYVDYRDFASSLGGTCVLHCGRVPSCVIDYDIDPQYCECVDNRQM